MGQSRNDEIIEIVILENMEMEFFAIVCVSQTTVILFVGHKQGLVFTLNRFRVKHGMTNQHKPSLWKNRGTKFYPQSKLQ